MRSAMFAFCSIRRIVTPCLLISLMIPKMSAAVQRDVLVGATALLNGAALVFVALLVGFVIAAFVRRQIREQEAKELAMAKDIQLSALPNVFPPFPDETRFDIMASMATAKEVGGDFYDFSAATSTTSTSPRRAACS